MVRYSAYKLTSHNAYFYTFWISDLVVSLAAILAIYEIFLNHLFAGFSKVRFYRNLFPMVLVSILLLTVLTVLQLPQRRAALLMVSRGFDFMRTAVLVFFIALMLFMGRTWARYDLGITLGFSLQASLALANAAFLAVLHYKLGIYGTLESVAYNLSCIIWIFTFSQPEQPVAVSAPIDAGPETLHEARKWESSLKDWLTPGKK